MSLAKKVFYGSAFLFAGSILASFISYLTKLILARSLTIEEYGLFFAIFTFISFFAIFTSLGLTTSLIKFIPELLVKKKENEIKSIFFGSLAIRFLVATIAVIIIWILSEWLANSFFGDERAKTMLRIFSFIFYFDVLYSTLRSFFNGFKHSTTLSLMDPTRNTVDLILISLGLILGFGVFAPVFGYLTSLVIVSIFFLIILLRKEKFWKRKILHFKKTNKTLLLFGLPLVLTSVGSVILSKFDTLMLTYYDSLSIVGAYNAIYPTAMLLGLAGASIGTILMPVVSELWTKKKKDLILNASKIMYKYLFLVLIPAVIVLVIIGNPLIRILFGEEYLIGLIAYYILLGGIIFKVITTINYQMLIGIGKNYSVSTIYVIGAVINIILNFLLIPIYSIEGAALATVISLLVMMLITFKDLGKELNIKLPLKSLIIILIVSAVIPLTTYLVQQINTINIYLTTIIGVVLGGIIYLLILYKIKYINLEEIKGIIR